MDTIAELSEALRTKNTIQQSITRARQALRAHVADPNTMEDTEERLEMRWEELRGREEVNKLHIRSLVIQLSMAQLLAAFRDSASPLLRDLYSCQIISRFMTIFSSTIDILMPLEQAHAYDELSTFHLQGMLDDMDAYLAFVQNPDNARLWRHRHSLSDSNIRFTRTCLQRMIALVAHHDRARRDVAFAAIHTSPQIAAQHAAIHSLSDDLRSAVVRLALPPPANRYPWQ